ncbi:bacillithiol system redox-active protein YtxJ [Salimicrobium halophilum]|uniref:Bacillithiol system protein YtxJ n=1 Tax=Salimicrobium halophilum TaxID=86666 RepID=A0A1G8VMI4_9BACI|nr:bacillithiol system redox-active protein YtxJ [Salimicrobium halophilum]SDJ66390.1 bacillithiol system protein YtxJ [Salimicrobium halophilum]
MERITSKEALQELLNDKKPFVLLKHSLTCPISATAKDAVSSFEKSSDVPVYMIPIQEARDVSLEVTAQLEIKHESPQAFYLDGEKVIWHGSHFDITEKALSEAVSS